jgi:hypothetical protein
MNTSQFRRVSFCTSFLVAVLIMAANIVRAQEVILQPGELRSNIAASGQTINATLAPPGTVTFDREDTQTQNMRLRARPPFALDIGIPAIYATAEGILYVDFCVPRAGEATCDVHSDPTAPDVTATITFGWGVIGSVNALGIGAKATFHSTAAVVERETARLVNYQLLHDMSASLGTLKTVAKIPILIPDIKDAQVTQPVAWTALLKRGRRYRFQIFAISKATNGTLPTPAFEPLNFSDSNFSGLIPQHLTTGKVQLQNLTISVSPDGALGLQEALASLQDQVGNLVDSLDALSNRVDEDLEALRQEQAELTERVTALEGNLNDLRDSFNNHTHDCVVQQVTPRKGEDKYIVKCGPPVKRP